MATSTQGEKPLAGNSHEQFEKGGVASTKPVTWNLEMLNKAPEIFESGFPETDGVKSVFFEGVPYEGKATRVFAYLAVPKVKPGEKVPGMVLVHGGDGSAFRRWAKFWCEQGYAAISMDTCGCVSGNEYGNEYVGHRRHEWAGPAGWGDFKNVAKPLADQWPYHAVAAVVRAHSLLRSLPEVDPDRIGLTGVSWGGYLTCMAASVDHRFAFAAPVYGCGFLNDNSFWKDNDGENGSTAEQFAEWCALFDPRHYLGEAKCDFLWVDGSNDFAYPLDSLQKSVELLKGVGWYRSTRLRMPHEHGPCSEHPKELVDFAAFKLKGNQRWGYPFVRETREALGRVTVEWQADADRIAKAEICWTADRGAWQKRDWKTAPMCVYDGYATAEGDLPAEATSWYVNLFAEDGKCVSGELFQRTDADIARVKAARADAAAHPELQPLPDGIAATFDFTTSPGKVRPALHGASWISRSYPRGLTNDDKAIAALKLDSFRTHDAPLVNSGQHIVDTHEIFPLMHLDASDPRNYVFKPTDHYLELNFALGMKCLYRLGTSIEHTGDWGYNTLNPPDHEQYAEVLAGIVRHYTRGWADGYRWADRITHWELFNEPDVAPCWRGTREEFIHLYVTCLKRLKTEFPELTIGGPGFGSFFSFGRELLRACREAGVKPDFVAWHYYGSNPFNILAQPAQVKAIAAEEGFPELELGIDEWHYVYNNSWAGVQSAPTAEIARRAREGRESATGIDSAAFTVQVETGFHDTPLAKSHYYGSGYAGIWGYADRFGRFNKNYYAMQATGELMADCEERATVRTANRRLSGFGAWTKDRKGASLLMTDFRGEERALVLKVTGIPLEARPRVRLLDDGHDLVEWTDFTWKDGVLTLRKAEPGSVVFAVDFR